MKGQDAPSQWTGSFLSPSQQRFWVLDQLFPQNPAQNVACCYRVAGSLDSKVLASALDDVVQRHEILRTEFQASNGVPAPVVLSSDRLPLHNVNLSDLPPEDREVKFVSLAQEETRKPFDLSRGPLLRATLFRLTDAEYALLLVAHRIICDETSARLLLDELAVSYNARLSGKPLAVAENASPYNDIAVGRVAASEERLSYWKERLAGAPSSIDLPTDRPRPPVQSFRGARFTVLIKSPLLERLRNLSRSQDATLFVTLLAAFNVLLFRYSRQDDLVTGTRVDGRGDSQLREIIGPLENTILFRVDLSGSPSFTELVRRVRDVAQGAFSHEVPFETLVEQSSLERDLF